jgi:hypothetical protein
MRKQQTVAINKLEFEQLQAEAALMWEMVNDYDDFGAVRRLHPDLAQRVIDADQAIQEAEDDQ